MKKARWGTWLLSISLSLPLLALDPQDIYFSQMIEMEHHSDVQLDPWQLSFVAKKTWFGLTQWYLKLDNALDQPWLPLSAGRYYIVSRLILKAREQCVYVALTEEEKFVLSTRFLPPPPYERCGGVEGVPPPHE